MPTATNSARRRSVASAPRTAADQALQERRERDGGDLKGAAHRREDVPPARRTRVARRRGERRDLRQRSACCEPTRRDGRRLISFTHLLTKPRSDAHLTTVCCSSFVVAKAGFETSTLW